MWFRMLPLLTALSRMGSLPTVIGPSRRSPFQGGGGMASPLVVIGGLLCLMLASSPSSAQPGGLYWQCAPPSGYCPVNTTYPLPVDGTNTGSSLTIVAGTQRALSIATATALTIPSTATVALIQAQGTNNSSGVCLYWQDDGTNPTDAAGQQLAAQGSVYYAVTSLPIKLIAANGASCTATISYYK